MFGYIYKTTNNLNGKIYIGKKHSTIFDPTYLGSGIIVNESIAKNGKENFTVELIEWCESIDELNEREKFWISALKSQDPSIGYNIAPGGDGGVIWKGGQHPSLGVRRLGPDNPFYGKHHTDATKQLVRDVWGKKMASGYVPPASGRKKVSKEGVVKLVKPDEIPQYEAQGWKRPDPPKRLDHPYKHSEETKKKIANSLKGRIVSSESKEKFKQTLANRTTEKKEQIRKNMSESHKCKAWVHNDEHFLIIDSKDLDYYLSRGYSRGRGPRKL